MKGGDNNFNHPVGWKNSLSPSITLFYQYNTFTVSWWNWIPLIVCQVLFCRYDSTTGTFTVPPGGDGYYYFSAYLSLPGSEYAYFDIELNGEVVSSAISSLSAVPSSVRNLVSFSGVTYSLAGIHGNMLFKA